MFSNIFLTDNGKYFFTKKTLFNYLNQSKYNIQIYKIIKKQVPKFFTPFLSKKARWSLSKT